MTEETGIRLARLRDELGKSQEEVASEIEGATQSLVSRHERGAANVGREWLIKYAEYYDASIDYLTGRTNDRYSHKRVKPVECPNEAQLPPGGYPVYGLTEVPVVGEITAGMPLLAIQEVSDKIMFPTDFLPTGKVFFLEVHGDSMNKAQIYDGDLALIQLTESVDDYAIAAVMVDNEEATIKKVHYTDGHIALLPESSNPRHRAQIYPANEVKVIGRFWTAIRRPQ